MINNQQNKKFDIIKWLTIFNTLAILSIAGVVGYFYYNIAFKSRPTPTEKPIVKNVEMAPLIEGAQLKGSKNAKVNIVVFNSFTCGYCKKSREVLHHILNKYPNQVRLVYRHFNRNDVDVTAANAAECAGEQNKFWQMYDQIFMDNTGSFNFVKYAQNMSLNIVNFNKCMASNKYVSKTNSDTEMGHQLGVNGTPTFVINGEVIVGYRPFEGFESFVKKYL